MAQTRTPVIAARLDATFNGYAARRREARQISTYTLSAGYG
jgi:hypothetical protein